jgi:HAD superfamily hydrolase (TIGR01549 family)
VIFLSNSPKSKFKAVLFDLDGTLIEFKFKVKESRLAMIEWLKKNNFDTSKFSSETKTQKIFDGLKLQTNSADRGDYETAKQALHEILNEFEFEGFSRAKPHPGSLQVLKRLKDEQILTGLVTNSGRRPVDSILGTFGFLPFLTTVITRDEMSSMKPEPDGILKAIEQLEVQKENTVYVGDSVIDIEAARTAGVSSIALSQGLYSRENLEKEKPDYLISNIEEVDEIIFGQNASNHNQKK